MREPRAWRGRIVLGDSSLATYLPGGGHWSVYLQYMLGLRALGYDVFLLELVSSSGDRTRDERTIERFLRRMGEYDLRDRCIVLLLPENHAAQPFEAGRAYGRYAHEAKEILTSADLLWNLCAAVRQPLLSLARRSVLIDLDPGYLQISGSMCDMGIKDHDAFLTLGHCLGSDDQHGPDLGIRWHTFRPFVYLPFWRNEPDPGVETPFTSITQWTWSSVPWKGNVLSTSKRDAYLRYLDLPRHVPCTMQLAVNIDHDDRTGDRELLEDHGWQLVHPHEVAATPALYRRYIRASRAEFLCPKPVFRELKTGWISDRSLCYLASGRPVLAENTGFTEFLPTGRGLLAFRTMDEAIEGVLEILGNYARHRAAARELAESHFSSATCLEDMVAASAA